MDNFNSVVTSQTNYKSCQLAIQKTHFPAIQLTYVFVFQVTVLACSLSTMFHVLVQCFYAKYHLNYIYLTWISPLKGISTIWTWSLNEFVNHQNQDHNIFPFFDNDKSIQKFRKRDSPYHQHYTSTPHTHTPGSCILSVTHAHTPLLPLYTRFLCHLVSLFWHY